MVMAWHKKIFAVLVVLVVAGITLWTGAIIANSLVTEVDPDLMKAECPGGKEWDGPGSSCHKGLIVDYIRPPTPDAARDRPQRMIHRKKRVR
jgi:hypothetical protein